MVPHFPPTVPTQQPTVFSLTAYLIANPKEQIPPPAFGRQFPQGFEFELFALRDAGRHLYIDETFLKAPGDIHEFSGTQAGFKG